MAAHGSTAWVERELELSLDELRREAVTMPVTMECAGNGRAQLEPHVVSQPWLAEAVGTTEWTGTPVRSPGRGGFEGDVVVFTGLDRGVEGGVEQDYAQLSVRGREQRCSPGAATASRCRLSTASRCA